MKLSPFADNPDITGLAKNIIDLMYEYSQRNPSKRDRFAPSLDITAKNSGFEEMHIADNPFIDFEWYGSEDAGHLSKINFRACGRFSHRAGSEDR